MDNLTKKQRRKNMQNIRSADTKSELLVTRELRKRKIYFARNVKSIFGKPDIVFRRKKTVVFIDSDFWHVHPTRFIMPKSNKGYWKEKILRNKERDKDVNRKLKDAGWKVIRIWEYDIKRDTDKCIKKILKTVEMEVKNKVKRSL